MSPIRQDISPLPSTQLRIQPSDRANLFFDGFCLGRIERRLFQGGWTQASLSPGVTPEHKGSLFQFFISAFFQQACLRTRVRDGLPCACLGIARSYSFRHSDLAFSFRFIRYVKVKNQRVPSAPGMLSGPSSRAFTACSILSYFAPAMGQ
jgi:hypothetical protein